MYACSYTLKYVDFYSFFFILRFIYVLLKIIMIIDDSHVYDALFIPFYLSFTPSFPLTFLFKHLLVSYYFTSYFCPVLILHELFRSINTSLSSLYFKILCSMFFFLILIHFSSFIYFLTSLQPLNNPSFTPFYLTTNNLSI